MDRFIKIIDLIDTQKEFVNKSLDIAKNSTWTEHVWGNYNGVEKIYNPNELEVFYPKTNIILKQWRNIFNDCFVKYIAEIEQKIDLVHISDIRYNKYEVGAAMLSHSDHIRSLFDGSKKGIPILSGIVAMNDESEYEGGDFIFTEYPDVKYRLKQGQVLIFPSIFCYSHSVSEVTAGTRYTGVCWSF